MGMVHDPCCSLANADCFHWVWAGKRGPVKGILAALYIPNYLELKSLDKPSWEQTNLQ